jgi:hypothetical protein
VLELPVFLLGLPVLLLEYPVSDRPKTLCLFKVKLGLE